MSSWPSTVSALIKLSLPLFDHKSPCSCPRFSTKLSLPAPLALTHLGSATSHSQKLSSSTGRLVTHSTEMSQSRTRLNLSQYSSLRRISRWSFSWFPTRPRSPPRPPPSNDQLKKRCLEIGREHGQLTKALHLNLTHYKFCRIESDIIISELLKYLKRWRYSISVCAWTTMSAQLTDLTDQALQHYIRST